MLRNLRFARAMWHVKDHAKEERDLRFSVSRFRSMMSMLERRHLSFVCSWKENYYFYPQFTVLPFYYLETTRTHSSMPCISISNSHHKEQHMHSDLYCPPPHFLAPYSILLSITEMLPHIFWNLWCITSKILYIFKFYSCFCLFRNSLLRTQFFLHISQMFCFVLFFLSCCLSH